jgi:gamma-glutamyltranspeptidase/glutathione hydrolase
MKKICSLIAISIVLFNCKTPEKKERITGLISQKAMVVSAREEASKIGADVLKKGGNAFDAMVATELALAVAYPYAGNIGGGGFMVYRRSDGEIGALDYREKAPLAASKDMYLDADKNIIKEKSTLGAMAVGIPGTVAGVFKVHEKFGSLPMKAILDPIIALAKRGVIVTKKQAKRIKSYQSQFLSANKEAILFHKNWKENDTLEFKKMVKMNFTKVKLQKN